MALARVTAYVSEDAPLSEHGFVRESGEPCAWLEVGDGTELGVWGSPAAMRRLAVAVIAAADAADALGRRQAPADASVGAA